MYLALAVSLLGFYTCVRLLVKYPVVESMVSLPETLMVISVARFLSPLVLLYVLFADVSVSKTCAVRRWD